MPPSQSDSMALSALCLYVLAACHASRHQLGRVYFPDQRQANFIKSLQEYNVVQPVKVDDSGQFLSYSLHHNFASTRIKRNSGSRDAYVYYEIKLKEQYLFLNLTNNHRFLSDNYILERRSGNHSGVKIKSYPGSSCHFTGKVLQAGDGSGDAAISTCNGLMGYFRLPHGDYFIEPIRSYPVETGAHQPHIIYKKHSPEVSHRHRRTVSLTKSPYCAVDDSVNAFFQQDHPKERWNTTYSKGRKVSQRSISKERWVETLVVADTKMVAYHGSENVESYIFTILNMVTGLFHDPSIGNAIHIMLVRLILLEEEEQGLKINHHADQSLASFCKWQKSVNPKSDAHPTHHDVAVLLTRKDICAGMNHPCETLGLSHLSGMCQPARSCNINEDSGLPLAFTIAHELGHSFGVPHDGQGNDCEVVGRHPYIMSRQLHYDTSPLTWSQCSKEYITRFLDRGLGFCLDDVPAKRDLKPPIVAPGVLYDVHHQCQLQYGPNATFCEDVDNICQTLWCSVDGYCRSKLDAAADGTRCGKNKWCFTGECVTVGKHPETVNGHWGLWSAWSHCTRTCGAGVQNSERQCNDPEPKFGGKYCTGERKRYRMCKILPCPNNMPTFRHMQCSEFDTVPYKNELHHWAPIPNKARPCELHCRPTDGNFADKMLDAVIDGTPCFEGSDSRDVCINGVCKNVGCDYEINSNATEDRCGVCLGDGSTCHTVRRTFNQTEGFGYVDIGLIPKGARDILVIEVAEAGNFLALRSQGPQKYLLNGGYIIQWNGDYKIAGTTFQYERNGDLENLTASGPTNQSLWLQLLFQETNPGIKYEYIIQKGSSKDNEIDPAYRWQYGRWTDCSATCGSGVKRQTAYCVKKGRGVVKKSFCDAQAQPNTRHKKCNERDCPPRWWAGEWQKCSTTCGPTGEMKRAVLCIQTVGSDEQALHADDCHHLLKPKTHVSCNRDVLCPSDWTVSNWTQCSVTCGGGVRMRSITCSKNNNEPCNIYKKPNTKALCGLQQCPFRRKTLLPDKTPTAGKILTRKIPRKRLPIPKPGPSRKKLLPKNNRRLLRTTIPPVIPGTTYSSTVTPSTKENIKVDTMLTHSTHLSRHRFVSTDSKELNSDNMVNATISSTVSGVDMEITTIASHNRSEEVDHVMPFNSSQRTRAVTPGYDFLTAASNQDFDNVDGSGQDEEDDDDDPDNQYETSYTTITTASSRMPHIDHSTTHTILATYSQDEITTQPSFTEVSDGVVLPTTIQRDTGVLTSIPVIEMAATERAHTTKPYLDENSISVMESNLNSSLLFVKLIHKDVNASANSLGDTHSHSNWKVYSRADQNISETTNMSQSPFWIVGNWSECSTNCGGGMKVREVLCIDAYEKRFLRPFHCQLLGPKPAHHKRCKTEACFQWQMEPWDECSTACGGGTQNRTIRCVHTIYNKTEDPGLCEQSEPRPQDSRTCNTQPCKDNAAPTQTCKMDKMSVNFCQTLKSIGKCELLNIRTQCCYTCLQRHAPKLT